jgi:Flp pilus assembly protein TadD
LDRAIAYLDKAIDLNPKDTRAYGDRSSAYLKKGDLKRSRDDFLTAIGFKPH